MVVKKQKFDLRAERVAFGLTQEEVAQILMATQPSVARWEKAESAPHVRRVLWWQWKKQVRAGARVDGR